MLTIAATAMAFADASARNGRHDGAPILLTGGQTIRMGGTAIYCTVEPLLHRGNELFCYDVRGLTGSYGFELSASGLAVLRFAQADKARIVWSRRHR